MGTSSALNNLDPECSLEANTVSVRLLHRQESPEKRHVITQGAIEVQTRPSIASALNGGQIA